MKHLENPSLSLMTFVSQFHVYLNARSAQECYLNGAFNFLHDCEMEIFAKVRLKLYLHHLLLGLLLAPRPPEPEHRHSRAAAHAPTICRTSFRLPVALLLLPFLHSRELVFIFEADMNFYVLSDFQHCVATAVSCVGLLQL